MYVYVDGYVDIGVNVYVGADVEWWLVYMDVGVDVDVYVDMDADVDVDADVDTCVDVCNMFRGCGCIR